MRITDYDQKNLTFLYTTQLGKNARDSCAIRLFRYSTFNYEERVWFQPLENCSTKFLMKFYYENLWFFLSCENLEKTVFFGHEKRVSSLSVNSKVPVFVTTGDDHKILLWDLRSPHAQMEQILPFNGLISSWSKCGRILAVAYRYEFIQILCNTNVLQNIKKLIEKIFKKSSEFHYIK